VSESTDEKYDILPTTLLLKKYDFAASQEAVTGHVSVALLN
jgi:hypothetical protein